MPSKKKKAVPLVRLLLLPATVSGAPGPRSIPGSSIPGGSIPGSSGPGSSGPGPGRSYVGIVIALSFENIFFRVVAIISSFICQSSVFILFLLWCSIDGLHIINNIMIQCTASSLELRLIVSLHASLLF